MTQQMRFWDTDDKPPHPQPLSGLAGVRRFGENCRRGRKAGRGGKSGSVGVTCATKRPVQIFSPLPLRERGWG